MRYGVERHLFGRSFVTEEAVTLMALVVHPDLAGGFGQEPLCATMVVRCLSHAKEILVLSVLTDSL